MRYIELCVSFLLAGCAASLPSKSDRQDPSHSSHAHIKQANYFAGITDFKPVKAGDWRKLNRNVAPEVKQ